MSLPVKMDVLIALFEKSPITQPMNCMPVLTFLPRWRMVISP